MATTHSYAIWDAESELTLCNVPWDSVYRDVVRFPSQSALNDYIDGLPNEDKKVITNLSYVRAFEPVTLDDAFNTVNQYNYVRVRQPGQETTPAEPGKTFYYFITGVNHIAPNATQVTLQLDVFQTFIYGVTFGRMYVERGHVGIANRDAFQNYGADYLTIDEGMDLGAEFQVDDVAAIELGQAARTLIYTSISMESGDIGDEDDPSVKVPASRTAFGLLSQMGAYIYNGSPNDFLSELKEYPWIVQGVIAAYRIPDLEADYGQTLDDANSDLNLKFAPQSIPNKTVNITNIRNHINIPSRYSHLHKFKTAPFAILEIDLMDGDNMQMRPEQIRGSGFTLYYLFSGVYGDVGYYATPIKLPSEWGPGTPPDIRLYNNFQQQEMTVSSHAVPNVAVINDGAALTLANSRNTRKAQRDSAKWSQTRSMSAVYNSKRLNAIGNSSIRQQGDITGDAAQAASDQQIAYNDQQMWTNGIASVGTGVIGGAAAGGLAGAGAGLLAGAGNAILGGIRTQQQNDQIRMTTERNLSTATALMNNQIATNDRTTAANADLARSSANGDYENTINTLNAAYRDTLMTPPAVVSQGGSNYMAVQFAPVAYVRWRRVPDGIMRQIGEYWLTFGYAINSWLRNVPNDMHVMSKFTYWKCTATYLNAARIPETFKNVIRGIFEKGVTVWRNPADIGNVDVADNEPIVRDYY